MREAVLSNGQTGDAYSFWLHLKENGKVFQTYGFDTYDEAIRFINKFGYRAILVNNVNKPE